MLDCIDETRHQMPLFLPVGIVGNGLRAPRVRGDDRFCALVRTLLAQIIRIVGAIPTDPFGGQSSQQACRLRAIASLSRGADQPQRVAHPIHTDVNFGAEAPATASERLVSLPAVFGCGAGGIRMRPHHRAVQDQVLPIRVIRDMGQHVAPDALVTPACEALIDAIPVAVVWRQIPPGCPRAIDPEHRFNEASAVHLGAEVHLRTVFQKGTYVLPLVIA